MMNATLTAKAAINNTQDATIPTVPESPATGSISGYLSFPSEFLPPMRVVAFNATNYSIYYFVDTVQGQSDYTIPGLPAGMYHIISGIPGVEGAGGYTQMVPCGLKFGCNDYSFIDVNVNAGQTTTNIDPGDWYAEAGTFPPIPNP